MFTELFTKMLTDIRNIGDNGDIEDITDII